MDEIGSHRARNTLSQLLARVERGEQIVITRRGRPVAKLVPFTTGAMGRIRTLAQQMNLGPFAWADWKNYRGQGRR